MPLQIRRGINADRLAITFDEGEPIYTTDTKRFYIGDGSTAGGIDPSVVTDGDKGDITVSGSGTVWSIDNATIDIPKIDATGTADATTFLRGDGSWSVPAVTDGDRGDITVSSSGTVWTIDNGVVGVAKINATGTADSTTFFRGDGSWAVPTVTDGDKGDITVSSGGTVWTIDNGVVGVAKISATGTADATTFLRGDGSWSTPSGGGFTPIRQAYTATTSGIAIPVGATRLQIIAWGGGGGGGGGALNNAGAARTGGGGGGGSCVFKTDWDVTMLSGTLSVVIGAGGTGGNGATTAGGAPASGGSGGTSTVTGTWNGVSTKLCYGFNGSGGGVSATGNTATGGTAATQGYQGGAGGGGSATATGSSGSTSASGTGLSIAGYGGGGGGGVNTSNVASAGGVSFGSFIPTDPNVAGGTTGGGAGGSEAAGRGTNWDYARAGGGGGGGNSGGSGGNGGNGGYGSGGGGGGGGTNVLTNTGGRGGDGGQGLVILYWS